MINQIIKKIKQSKWYYLLSLFIILCIMKSYHFYLLPLYVNSRLQRECNQCISLCIHYSNCVEADQDGVQL